MIIRLPIDLKSLYYNIKNDNQSGHTATVATPLKQGSSINEDLWHIYSIPESITGSTKEDLIISILSKSRADASIRRICVFDKIAVNGELIENNNVSFCMYIREEINPQNVHFGRQKVHYPQSLHFQDEIINIDNKYIMKLISKQLLDYAFIVEAFEYDEDTEILNFDILVVGPNNIPYSKIFLNKRGTGTKFTSEFNEGFDNYDTEIISLREIMGYDKVGPENYQSIQQENKIKAIDIIKKDLQLKNVRDVRNLTRDYPYSLYDLSYIKEGRKEYVIIKFTDTKMTYFSLPYSKIRFGMDYKDKVLIAFVKCVSTNPIVEWYTFDELNKMYKSINSMVYEKRS